MCSRPPGKGGICIGLTVLFRASGSAPEREKGVAGRVVAPDKIARSSEGGEQLTEPAELTQDKVMNFG